MPIARTVPAVFILFAAFSSLAQSRVTNVTAAGDQIIVQGHSSGASTAIIELAPFETIATGRVNKRLAFFRGETNFTIRVARVQNSRDLAYSSFAAIDPANADRFF